MKKPPQKPTNLTEYDCHITLGQQIFTKLEISPDYQEKNKDFGVGLKEKGIRLTKQELAKVLITDKLIHKLVQQLAGSGDEKRINYEGSYYQYSYYSIEPLYNQ